MAFKFEIKSTALTDYARILDNAKLNPFFDPSYLAEITSAQSKVNYVYGLAMINTLPKFKQEDFNEDTYNEMYSQDKEAAFSYLAYKALGDKSEEDDKIFNDAAEHYHNLYRKDQMSGAEKFWSGVGLALQDAWMFFVDVVDTIVDIPVVLTVLGGEPLAQLTGNEKSLAEIQKAKDIIESDWIMSWASGGKNIDEVNLETRLKRFYTTDQFATLEDALNGAQWGDPLNWGNAIDFLGGAAGSLAKMALNFIPIAGPYLYWGLTAAEIAKESVQTIDNPYLRLVRAGGQFAIEYLTEMIFTDSFIETGLIKTGKWIPSTLTGLQRALAKLGVDATTNAIEELSAEILNTLLDQALYSTFGSSLSVNDLEVITPQWDTLVGRSIMAAVSGALVGVLGAAGGIVKTARSSVVTTATGEKVKLKALTAWSIGDIVQGIATFSDPNFMRNRVYDNMKNPTFAGKVLSDNEIFATQEYKDAVQQDIENQKEYVAVMQTVRNILENKGYKDAVTLTEDVSKNFQQMAMFYRNYQTNSINLITLPKALRKDYLKIKGKFIDANQVFKDKATIYKQHYNGKYNISATDSSYTNAELNRLALRAGLDAIIIGKIGNELGRTPDNMVIIDKTLFVNDKYFQEHGGTRGLKFKEIIVSHLVTNLTNEPMFAANDYGFYKKVIRVLRNQFGHGNLPYTKLVEEKGLRKAHNEIMTSFLNSQEAMRLLFKDVPSFINDFDKILKKQNALLLNQYGKDAEAKLVCNHRYATIVNTAVGAGLQDIATFNKSLLHRLETLAKNTPINKRLAFISQVLATNQKRIQEEATTPDVWLLRDLGFTKRENKIDVLKQDVIDYLDTTGIIAMAYRERKSDFIPEPNNISVNELGAIILQSEDVQNYLGLNSPNFRNLFIAHLYNVITSDKVNVDTKRQYLNLLTRFITTAFALETKKAKTEIAKYIKTLNAYVLALEKTSTTPQTTPPPITSYDLTSYFDTTHSSFRTNFEIGEWAALHTANQQALVNTFNFTFRSLAKNKKIKSIRDVMRFLISEDIDSLLPILRDLVSKNPQGITVSQILDIFDISADMFAGVGNDLSLKFISNLLGEVITTDDILSQKKIIVSKSRLNIKNALLSVVDSFGMIINTTHDPLNPTVHKIVDMLQFINPNLRKKSKKMLTRQLSEPEIDGVADLTPKITNIMNNLYNQSVETEVSIDFLGSKKVSSLSIGLAEFIDVNKYGTFLDGDGDISVQRKGEVIDKLQGMMIHFVPEGIHRNLNVRGWYDGKGVYVVIPSGYVDIVQVYKTLLHEITHAIVMNINDDVTQRMPILLIARDNVDVQTLFATFNAFEDINQILQVQNDVAFLKTKKGSLSMATARAIARFVWALRKEGIIYSNATASAKKQSPFSDMILAFYAFDLNEMVARNLTRADLANMLIDSNGIIGAAKALSDALTNDYGFTNTPSYKNASARLMYSRAPFLNNSEETQNALDLDKFYTKENIVDDTLKTTFDLISRVGLNLTDLTFLEPSAGAGAYVEGIDRFLPEAKVDAYDIAPEAEGIVKADFLEQSPTYQENRIIVGNPPFGTNGDLATQFVNRSAEWGPVVSFILPASFSIYQRQRNISQDLKLVYESELIRDDAFTVNDDAVNVKTVHQIWVKKSDLRFESLRDIRLQHEEANYHPDFKMLLYYKTDGAKKYFNKGKYGWDFAINIGSYHNEIITDERDLDENKNYIFIKGKNKEATDILLKLNYDQIGRQSKKLHDRVSQTDIVKAYRQEVGRVNVYSQDLGNELAEEKDWMNDSQKKVIRDINTELKALLKEAEPNETKLYILKKLVSNANLSKNQQELNAGVMNMFKAGTVSQVLAKMGTKQQAAKTKKTTIEETEVTPVLPSTTPLVKPIPVKKVKRRYVSKTNYKVGQQLSTQDLNQSSISFIPTSDVNLHHKVVRVLKQGGTTNTGETIKAQVEVYTYEGKAKELDTQYVGAFGIKGRTTTVPSDLNTRIGKATQRLRALGSMIRTTNLKDVSRSPYLSEIDKDVRSDLLQRQNALTRAYVALQTKLKRARTIDKVSDLITEINQSDFKKLENEALSIKEAIIAEIKRVQQVAKEQKRYETEKRRKDKEESLLALEKERAIIRKEILGKKIAELKAKRKKFIEEREAIKISEEENLAKVKSMVEAMKGQDEYDLLDKLLSKKIATKEAFREALEANPDIIPSFNKFISDKRGFANVRRALIMVHGEEAYTTLVGVFTRLYEAQRKIAEEARQEKKVETTINNANKFAKKFLKANIMRLESEGELEDFLAEEVLPIIDELDDLELPDEVDNFIEMILTHPQMYNEKGEITQAGISVKEALENWVQEEIPNKIDVEEQKKNKQTPPKYEPYLLSAAQQKMFDKFIADMEKVSPKKLPAEIKLLLTHIFGYVTTTAQSTTKFVTQEGLTAEMYYNRTVQTKFAVNLGEMLDKLTPTQWMLMGRFLYESALRRVLPADILNNIVNTANYYSQLWMEGSLEDTPETGQALSYFNLLRNQLYNNAGTMLAKAKITKRYNKIPDGGVNIPEAVKVDLVNYYIDVKELSPEDAVKKAEEDLKFHLNLQFFAKGGLLSNFLADTSKAYRKDVNYDAFIVNIRKLLSDSGLFQTDENSSAEQKINDIISGAQLLDSDNMSILWQVAKANGDYLSLLYIKDLYEQKAREHLKDVKFKDMFSKNPKQAHEARQIFWKKIMSFRYMAMLSNPSVYIKNFTQNRANSLLDKFVVSPLAGTLF